MENPIVLVELPPTNQTFQTPALNLTFPKTMNLHLLALWFIYSHITGLMRLRTIRKGSTIVYQGLTTVSQ